MSEELPLARISAKQRPESNPVFAHLTRRRTWLTLRTGLILCFALTLIGTLAVTVAWRPSVRLPGRFSPGSHPAAVMIIAGITTLIIAPFISAAVATAGTSRFAGDEMFTMLKLTSVSPHAVMRGLLWAALFRLRLLWVICFGLLIPLLAAWTIVGIELNRPYAEYYGAFAPPTTTADFLATAGHAGQIILLGGVLGIILNWLALCVGIHNGLRWWKPAPSLALSLIGVLISIIMLMLCEWVGAELDINLSVWRNHLIYPVRSLIILIFSINNPLRFVIELAFIYLFAGMVLLQSAQSRL